MGDDNVVALDTVSVPVADNAFDYVGNEQCAFKLTFINKTNNLAIYTVEHNGLYLASDGKGLVMQTEPYPWGFTTPLGQYDKEKDSYYVSWVGEYDDNTGGGAE